MINSSGGVQELPALAAVFFSMFAIHVCATERLALLARQIGSRCVSETTLCQSHD